MSQQEKSSPSSSTRLIPEGVFVFLWSAALALLGLNLDLLGSTWGPGVKIVAAALTIALPLFYLFFRFNPIVGFINDSVRDLRANNAGLETLTRDLENLQTESAQLRKEITGLQKFTSLNSEIVEKGFMGLQHKAMLIESLPATNESWLYVVSRHLASHFRDTELDINLGRQLYNAWQPERLISEYVKGINQRMRLLDTYLDAGGNADFFFEYDNLEDYKSGHTQFDENIDPVEERKSRFRKLQSINRRKNCNVFLFRRSLGNNMIVRFETEAAPSADPVTALLMDLRLPYSSTNFEESCYGIYSTAPQIVGAYRVKAETILKSARRESFKQAKGKEVESLPMVISDQEEIDTLLSQWLSEI